MNLIKTVPEAQGLFRYNPPCCNPRATIGNFLFSFLHFRQQVSIGYLLLCTLIRVRQGRSYHKPVFLIYDPVPVRKMMRQGIM